MVLPHANPVALVVDDEPLLLMETADIVACSGFNPLQANNSDEALEILNMRDDVAVLVTDIDMPNGSIDGLRLARAVREKWPQIGIIVISGQRGICARDLPHGGLFIRKPCSPTDVEAALQFVAA